MKLIDQTTQEPSSSSVLKKFQSSVQDVLKLSASDEDFKGSGNLCPTTR